MDPGRRTVLFVFIYKCQNKPKWRHRPAGLLTEGKNFVWYLAGRQLIPFQKEFTIIPIVLLF